MFRLRQQFRSGLHFKEMIKHAFSSVLSQIKSAGKAPSWALWGKCYSISWSLKSSTMQFYLDMNQLLFASVCSSYVLSSCLSSSWKILSVCEHMDIPDSLPQCLHLTLLCLVCGGRFQSQFFWRLASSCCQYICCFSPASHGTVSVESHFSRSSVYLCYVIWVGRAWWTAGCDMFPQNGSVSRSFPVAGWEHGTLDLNHVVGFITWTTIFDIKGSTQSANVWPSIM